MVAQFVSVSVWWSGFNSPSIYSFNFYGQ